ncbi:hypothetical protein BX666DRAFT_2114807 [Dichotomocladium elegans]|nr:hypothetical protein BX666DRAFT_2114807 [Dichotomocladium elegans]
MTIQRLPSELFGRIAELLSRGDLHQCILVNRTLNTAMTPFLYRTISVTTAANVFHSLSKLNGAFVRQLVAEDDVLSPEDIQTLCSLCPNLTELEYVWPNKDTVHTPGSRSFFPRSPPLLLRHIVDPKRLVSLQLCYHEARYCAEDISIDIVCQFFFSLLRHLPSRLHSLSLVGLLPILQVTHLEAIHMACPSLTHLTIEGSNMRSLNSSILVASAMSFARCSPMPD